MKRVIVGMSGGVDSSVTALLLKEQGYEVIGVFMKNWEEEGPCPAADDYQDVISVCTQLKIPYYSLNFSKEYWERVFSRCLKEFEEGHTPNPDILCNQEIKFKVFFEKAMQLDADFLATGHYARTEKGFLKRGFDGDKDQSYFLYTLKSSVLEKVLFPIGHLKKQEVRKIALENGLVTAQKKDSTGICFIGKRDFKEFLSRYIPKQKGVFKTPQGKVVGTHEGMAYYTIGQRKGLAIGGKGEAWFVIGKDKETNTVFVEQGKEHQDLFANVLLATEETWVSDPPAFPLRCTAKIRYRAPDVPCLITKEHSKLHVLFDTPQKAITPRQSIVFYHDEICLGGAMIEQALN